MPRLTPRQALIAACLLSGILTAACASVKPTPYVDQAALTLPNGHAPASAPRP